MSGVAEVTACGNQQQQIKTATGENILSVRLRVISANKATTHRMLCYKEMHGALVPCTSGM